MKHHIRIIAPSSTLTAYNESEAKLKMVEDFLRENGFEVSIGPEMFANPPLPFYANTREIRLQHFKNALEDPKVDIIWAFRGGTGAAEIAIPATKIKPINNKILIGFSDITTLHTLFNQHYKIPTIHGPVLTSLLDKHPYQINNIKDILNKKPQFIKLIPQNESAKAHSHIEAEITGGNLTVLCCAIGTELDPDTNNKILIIEDVAERGYRIRRSLTHLEQTGKINKVAACILGDFSDSDDKLDWALEDFIERNQAIPIFRVKEVGHGDENIPVVFGTKATIINSILTYSF